MDNATTTSLQLTDIVVPTAAPSHAYEWVVAVLIIVFGAFIVVLAWRWYHSSLQEGLRKLKRVQTAYGEHQITNRMACFHMTAILKQHLGISYLSSAIELPSPLAEQQMRWDLFTQRLHQFRYARQSGAARDIEALILETRYWMCCWP